MGIGEFGGKGADDRVEEGVTAAYAADTRMAVGRMLEKCMVYIVAQSVNQK
jgi:hypothetical protein